MFNEVSSLPTQENLRLKDAARYLGISRVTLHRLQQRDPLFPSVIRITSRCCVFRKSDLDAYLASKLEVSV
ncbi:helix-turn-helix domain-containing protein [Marinomonas sp. GJ51-6]|uniref:helix-turn-helix transcriptional regulator n=1 Tax=Marinomonas sp. GJ51-6 TaxID=2992802 RepID=UPI0029349620|nr:helix-turn-helix domain-containing protein [Marinomonas sp. GJ51-6]WOD08096.1 helix-turn-helix domain-containing protein [Marinomonas sp. GJ51-6]